MKPMHHPKKIHPNIFPYGSIHIHTSNKHPFIERPSKAIKKETTRT